MQLRQALCWVVLAALPFRGACLDLLSRYPTELTEGDGSPNRARPWDFNQSDIFHLKGFEVSIAGLHVETSEADLGIGHCADGVVWAIVIPRLTASLNSPAADTKEKVGHIWLRFHPKEVNQLFPAALVSEGGNTNLLAEMMLIARAKFGSSWHAGMNAMIPAPKDLTVDVDTTDGPRRFFVVDTQVPSVRYVSSFEGRKVTRPAAVTGSLAEQAFDTLWQTFDREYAMFVLRPEVDWAELSKEFRPKALAAKSNFEFATVCAEMLRPLRDLHIWMRVGSADVPVFNRMRMANANLSANEKLFGRLKGSSGVQWAITTNRVGFLAIYNWGDAQVVEQCNQALDAMLDTRGMIVDVRLNGGGSEDLAEEVAGRFLSADFVYAYSQFRSGAGHDELTRKVERIINPRGPWRYNRPVLLLIGQKCMSSNESFVAMMSGAPQVTTMGDHTCGSSGNPRMLELPMDIKVSVPRWIDYLPDGTQLDERGFQPQVQFKPPPGAFAGNNDELLVAALERASKLPLPAKPIDPSRFDPN